MAAHTAELKYVCALFFPLMNPLPILLLLDSAEYRCYCKALFTVPFAGYSYTLEPVIALYFQWPKI